MASRPQPVDQPDGEELGPSSYVVLGMLALGLRSGYEIKRAADDGSRHFLALSFRQIYPELHRLERLGMVTASDAATGDRRRTFYELTPAGRAALVAWLAEPGELQVELRHSGIVKLLFADGVGRDEQLALLTAIRTHHEEAAATMERVRAAAEQDGQERCMLLTLDFGIELERFMADWCERTAAELRTA